MSKKFLKSLLAVIATLIIALPTLASTDWAKRWIWESMIKNYQFDSIELSWLGKQKIFNIAGPYDIHVENLVVNEPLWYLLIFPKSTHNIHFSNLNGNQLNVERGRISVKDDFVHVDLDGNEGILTAHVALNKKTWLPDKSSKIEIRQFPLETLNLILPSVQVKNLFIDIDMYVDESGTLIADVAFTNFKQGNIHVEYTLDTQSTHIAGKNVPTEILPPGNQLFGPLLDFNVDMDGKKGNLEVSSERIRIPEARFILGEALTALEPFTAYARLNSTYINSMLSPIQLETDTTVRGTIDHLSIPLSFEDIELRGQFDFEPIAIRPLPQLNGLNVQNANIKVDRKQFILHTNLMRVERNTYIEKLLHEITEITIQGAYDGKGLAFEAIAENINAHLTVQGNLSDILELSSDFRYDLTPNAWLRLNAQLPKLLKPATIHLQTDSLTIPKDHLIASELFASGKLYIDEIFLDGDNTIQTLIVPWKVDGKKNLVSASVKAHTSTGIWDSETTITNWHTNPKKLRLSSEAHLSNVPIGVLGGIIGIPELPHLIGESVNADWKLILDSTQQNSGSIDLQLSGDQCHILANLTADTQIHLTSLNKPVELDWTLTPERFQILRKMLKNEREGLKSLTLNEAAHIQAKLTDLTIPWGKFSLIQTSGIFDLKMPSLSIHDRATNQSTVLKNLEFKAATHDFSEAINFSLSTNGRYLNSPTSIIELSAEGSVENLIDAKGKFNKGGASMSLNGHTHNAPLVLLIDLLFPTDELIPQVDALIGNQLTGSINFNLNHMEGPFKINLQGPHGEIKLNSAISQGYMRLNEPLIARFELTPRLSDSFISDLVPLLSPVIGSNHRATIIVEKEGFSLPIHHFDFADLSVGQLMVDLGRVTFKNEGSLQDLLEILKVNPDEGPDKLSVWFTPIYVNISQGVAKCQRLDMLLAGKYPIAMWGTVNFPHDKVRMTIGLGKETMRRAFGIKGIPKGYIFQLPLKGTTSKTKIDKSGTTSKIASLIAKSQGGPQGLILGGIFDLFAREKPPPEPTTYPFPWESISR